MMEGHLLTEIAVTAPHPAELFSMDKPLPFPVAEGVEMRPLSGATL